jgi:hypothetical protein
VQTRGGLFDVGYRYIDRVLAAEPREDYVGGALLVSSYWFEPNKDSHPISIQPETACPITGGTLVLRRLTKAANANNEQEYTGDSVLQFIIGLSLVVS